MESTITQQLEVSICILKPIKELIGGRIEIYNDNSLLLNGNFIGTVRKEFGDLKLNFSAGASIDDRNYEITSQRV
ncbi:MAG: hypothetical protein IPK25_16215 [Saprospiraceae bacterium]|nr:hypothetical protein [Saprospiraceae bacterium]